LTFNTIARYLGVTNERARQIYHKAVKLRERYPVSPIEAYFKSNGDVAELAGRMR